MEEDDNKNPVGVYTTHNFLFTLAYEKNIKGKKVLFISRDNKEKLVTLKDVEVSSSPVSCKLITDSDEKITIPYLRIKKIYDGDEMIWDNSDTDLSNVKVIKRD